MLVYFLRFFALQRTTKSVRVGGFEPFLARINKKNIEISTIPLIFGEIDDIIKIVLL